MPDIEDLLNSLSESETRIETRRSGPFMFRLGVDGIALAPLYQRVLDAHERLNASPLSQVARRRNALANLAEFQTPRAVARSVS